jgi:5-methylcytosine-specific restriction endonuclease McrA
MPRRAKIYQPQEPKAITGSLHWQINNRRWRKLSLAYRRAHPLCELCLASNELKPSEEVDHIISRDKAPDRIYDWDNLQALCKQCHSKKTRREQLD